MRRLILSFLFAASALGESKTYDAVYVASLSDIPSNIEKLDVWIPLPQSGEHQTVSDVTIESPYEFRRYRESVWGNEYAHAVVSKPPSAIDVRVRFTVTRNEATMDGQGGVAGNLDRALQPDRLVTLSTRIR